jgi:hypothetical protein
MKKGLIIKLAIVLVVLVLSYCVFWFYKAGQSEKQINKFIADNSAYISAGEISVTGFPVGQKIVLSDLKITVPVNLVAKRQIIIKQVEATSGIFSNDFVVNLVDVVKIQDLENSGDIFDVEFGSKPEILVSLFGGSIAKLQYNDSGFKILDAEKNVVNSSTGLSILSENSVDESDKRINKINISFKELEGYAVIDFYKNVLEKKVIEGIKTEEIKVNVAPVIDQANIQQFTMPLSQDQAMAVPNNIPGQPPVAMDPNSPTGAPVAPAMPNPPINGQEVVAQAMAVANQPANNVNVQAQQPEVNPAQIDNNQVPSEPNNIDPNAPKAPEAPVNAVIKNNITIDVVITLTPSIKQEQAESPPSDPTQIQELPVQYVQNIKINNVEISNDLFKINITGDVVNSSDDNYPSGGITVKVEKISNLVNQLKVEFKKLSEAKKPSVPSNGVDLINDQSQQQNQVQNYDIFLNNISDKLSNISTEIALKNSASKDEIAQFDVRREKNLEFLVNEVSVREIVGKF